MQKRVGILFLVFILFIGTGSAAQAAPLTPAYSVERVLTSDTAEYRFWADTHHFATLIDKNGVYAFRPHPGCDLNGWGSTWYAQPFLPGAVLKHTNVSSVSAAADGVHVTATGKVSRDSSATYGDWTSTLVFTYTPGTQFLAASGSYTITLAGTLGTDTGDLNLYKLASNYLKNVPLLSGGSGDTGDMQLAYAQKSAGTDWITWVPPDQPGHFPSDTSDYLSVDAIGWLNQVDTAAQGHIAIAPAFKPGLKVTLASTQPNAGIRFGAIYDLSKSSLFWADNVGITPLISRFSEKTFFSFTVALTSTGLERCIYLPLVKRE